MNLSTEIKKQYFNTPQMEAMYIAANTTVIVGGRRLGKSHGFGAPFLLRNMKHMPGSSGGVVGTSYQQLLTRTLSVNGTYSAMFITTSDASPLYPPISRNRLFLRPAMTTPSSSGTELSSG